MTLGELLRGIDDVAAHGPDDVSISSLTCDSRTAEPGALFAALAGATEDGARYAADAVANGAVAVLADRRLDGIAVPQVVAERPRLAFAQICEAFHGRPSERLALIGVTGTNGKTTVACLVRAIFAAAGRRCGMLGTVGYDNGTAVAVAPLTTPDTVRFSALLAEMAENGCDAAVAELSSHALAQDRAGGARLAAGVFTNLTQDHP
ncbi:MAG: Mur ligase family protein, partial [Planctomycetota bacterium]